MLRLWDIGSSGEDGDLGGIDGRSSKELAPEFRFNHQQWEDPEFPTQKRAKSVRDTPARQCRVPPMVCTPRQPVQRATMHVMQIGDLIDTGVAIHTLENK